jgi:hypothetical protein
MRHTLTADRAAEETATNLAAPFELTDGAPRQTDQVSLGVGSVTARLPNPLPSFLVLPQAEASARRLHGRKAT